MGSQLWCKTHSLWLMIFSLNSRRASVTTNGNGVSNKESSHLHKQQQQQQQQYRSRVVSAGQQIYLLPVLIVMTTIATGATKQPPPLTSSMRMVRRRTRAPTQPPPHRTRNRYHCRSGTSWKSRWCFLPLQRAALTHCSSRRAKASPTSPPLHLQQFRLARRGTDRSVAAVFVFVFRYVDTTSQQYHGI